MKRAEPRLCPRPGNLRRCWLQAYCLAALMSPSAPTPSV
ncbi:MAG: hypothetical protein AW07_02774 [Candidatus Accumulibacter sp. SK-11]|nr:MAG: hypothetical protein AW07_02774 [Candidatus Accumulibacter sp. SK-11]